MNGVNTLGADPGLTSLLSTLGGLAAAARTRCVESFLVPAGLALADVTGRAKGSRAAIRGGVS